MTLGDDKTKEASLVALFKAMQRNARARELMGGVTDLNIQVCGRVWAASLPHFDALAVWISDTCVKDLLCLGRPAAIQSCQDAHHPAPTCVPPILA